MSRYFSLSTTVIILAVFTLTSVSNDSAIAIDDEKPSKTEKVKPVQGMADIHDGFNLAATLAEITATNKDERDSKLQSAYGRPIRISNADQAAKVPALEKINKNVDYEKQDLIIFFLHNISSNVKAKVETSKDNEPMVVFDYFNGPTKDLRSHYQVFSIRKGLKWKVVHSNRLQLK